MTEAGTINGAKDSPTIGAAKRAVIFLWIELGPDQRTPASLSHRMVFAAGAPSEGSTSTETTLEDFPVAVSQEAVPRLSPPFAGGVWLAGDGPSDDSGHRRSIFAIAGHIYSPERFAIDWVKVGAPFLGELPIEIVVQLVHGFVAVDGLTAEQPLHATGLAALV
jgi:hypothetical protein